MKLLVYIWVRMVLSKWVARMKWGGGGILIGLTSTLQPFEYQYVLWSVMIWLDESRKSAASHVMEGTSAVSDPTYIDFSVWHSDV
jgi:hypothetical protein